MPTVIRYDDLTWPEVASLPRDLPMVIPLGLGEYDLTVAAQTLDTDRLCLLPAIPYGFRRADDDWLGKLAEVREQHERRKAKRKFERNWSCAISATGSRRH